MVENTTNFQVLSTSLNNELLEYWDQLASIQQFFHDPDRSNVLVFEIPLAFKNRFVIPAENALNAERNIIATIEKLKGYKIEYYHFLQSTLKPTIRNFSFLIESIILNKPPQNILFNRKILIELLNEELFALKNLIITGAGYLDREQEYETIKIINDHYTTLGQESNIAVPEYILKPVEAIFKTTITSEMVNKFSQNKGIIIIYYKFFKMKWVKEFSEKNNTNLITLLSLFLNNPGVSIINLFRNVAFIEDLLNYNFSEEEAKEAFHGNRDLFEIIILLSKSNGQPVSFKIKRSYVQIYKGQKSINKFLPWIKRKIPYYPQYLTYLAKKKQQMDKDS